MKLQRTLTTCLIALTAILAASAVAHAAPRGGRQNNPAAIAAKAQALVNKANIQINAQSTRFSRCVEGCYDDLDDLTTRVTPRTSPQQVLRFADDFEDDLLDDERKTHLKIDSTAQKTRAQLTRLGAPASFHNAVETTRSRARLTVDASVNATMADMQVAVRMALSVCGRDDDDHDDDDQDDDRGGNGGSGGNDDDDNDNDDDRDNDDDSDDDDDDRDDNEDDDDDNDD